MKNSEVVINKEIMGGTPVFKGTRVPIEYLFGFVEEGKTINDFISDYPTVKKKQAIKVMQLAEKLVQKLPV